MFTFQQDRDTFYGFVMSIRIEFAVIRQWSIIYMDDMDEGMARNLYRFPLKIAKNNFAVLL